MRSLVGVATALLLVAGCASAERTAGPENALATIPVGWSTHTNEVAGFSLSYPDDWGVLVLDEAALESIEGPGQERVDVDGSVPVLGLMVGETQEGGTHPATVGLSFAGMRGDVDAATEIDEAYDAAFRPIALANPSFELVSSTTISLGDRDATVVYSTYDLMGDPDTGIGQVHSTMLYIAVDQVLWSLECRFLSRTDGEVEDGIGICEDVIDTFRVDGAG